MWNHLRGLGKLRREIVGLFVPCICSGVALPKENLQRRVLIFLWQNLYHAILHAACTKGQCHENIKGEMKYCV